MSHSLPLYSSPPDYYCILKMSFFIAMEGDGAQQRLFYFSSDSLGQNNNDISALLLIMSVCIHFILL